MAYTLEKPYSDKEKADFIVEYNHKLGLKIEETESKLFALENNELLKDGKAVINPNYEEELLQKENEHISKLTVTKRVFALALQRFGITYTQLKELIATDEQAQLEWDLCVELERSNPLLDEMASRLDITSEQLDYIFKAANGEEI